MGSVDGAKALFGNLDANLPYLRKLLNVRIITAGGTHKVAGDDAFDVENAAKVLELLLEKSATHEINKSFIDMAVESVGKGMESKLDELTRILAYTHKGRPVRAKTFGQAYYARCIERNKVVFGIGPAGTGKTYLAVALAATAFKNREVEKIILTRPAVEAGEKLGFLPGDLGAKVDPYLRPLYDALQEMFGAETYSRLMERGAIEVAPLAYMRGRTLSEAFIILDEAQNATREQMKMFLTRMGEGSKIVVTGDATQIDLPQDKRSGLLHAAGILEGIEGIEAVTLTASDVVRHPLVQAIVAAYEKDAEEKESYGQKDKK